MPVGAPAEDAADAVSLSAALFPASVVPGPPLSGKSPSAQDETDPMASHGNTRPAVPQEEPPSLVTQGEGKDGLPASREEDSPACREDTGLPSSHGQTGPPPSNSEGPGFPVEENPGEEPPVIACGFPPTDLDNWEYTVFKNDVMAIIDEAERLSGIKTIYGVFVMDLVNSFMCGVNENLTRVDTYDNMKEGYFNSASVIKLFQGYILCDMIRRGELSMDEAYYDPVTGRKFRLLEMIREMISLSDNNYSNAALRLIGNQKSNEVLDRLGIHNSRIYGEMSGAIGYSRENNLKKYGTVKRCARITPRDTGLILYNIYVNRETDIFMETLDEALKANIYNTRIPVGVKRVNPDYEIAHKTGTNSSLGFYNDAGIIYCKRPFILVVFTQSVSSRTGHSFIRTLAEKLTRYFDSKASGITQGAGSQSISSGSRPG